VISVHFLKKVKNTFINWKLMLVKCMNTVTFIVSSLLEKEMLIYSVNSNYTPGQLR
jgi:hypothetical protein